MPAHIRCVQRPEDLEDVNKSVGHPHAQASPGLHSLSSPLSIVSKNHVVTSDCPLRCIFFCSISFPGTASFSYPFETSSSVWAALESSRPCQGSRALKSTALLHLPQEVALQAMVQAPKPQPLEAPSHSSPPRCFPSCPLFRSSRRMQRSSVGTAPTQRHKEPTNWNSIRQVASRNCYTFDGTCGQITRAPGCTLLSPALPHSPHRSSFKASSFTSNSCPRAHLFQTFAEWSGTAYWYGIPPGASLSSDPGWFTRLAS